jgi:hypothetical protein
MKPNSYSEWLFYGGFDRRWHPQCPGRARDDAGNPHFGLPIASVPSGSSGRITSAGPGRQIQLVLKLFF